MKKVDDFIRNDMPGHVALTGAAIRKYFDPAVKMTGEERRDYTKGLFTVYPYMMLANYHNWFFEGAEGAKNPKSFMESHQPVIIARATPVLEKWYNGKDPTPYAEKVQAKIDLFMEIPYDILGGYHKWVYSGKEDVKDFQEFIDTTRETFTSILGGVVLKAYYDREKPMTAAAKTEVMLFFATQFPYMFLRRYYIWLFGEEMPVLPGGPPQA